MIFFRVSSSSIAFRKKRQSLTLIVRFTQFLIFIAKIKKLCNSIDTSTIIDDSIQNKIAQQLLKILITAKKFVKHLKKIIKAIFTIAVQFNNIAMIRTTIRDELIRQYNNAIETQRTTQTDFDKVLDLQRVVYDESKNIDDYLKKIKLKICLKKFVDFLEEKTN